MTFVLRLDKKCVNKFIKKNLNYSICTNFGNQFVTSLKKVKLFEYV